MVGVCAVGMTAEMAAGIVGDVAAVESAQGDLHLDETYCTGSKTLPDGRVLDTFS